MTHPPRRLLTDADKDALLDRQAALIDALRRALVARNPAPELDTRKNLAWRGIS